MRILFVAPNINIPGTNGGSTHVTEVVGCLRENHDVLVLARRGSSGDKVIDIGSGVLPGPLRYLLPIVHFPLAYYHARKFQPDVIYERFSAFGLGVLLGRALRVPVLSMVLDHSATTITYRGADRLISTAPHLVPKSYHQKVEKVCWGANTHLFSPEVDGLVVRKKLGIEDSEIVIGYTGGFYHWHGLENLVEAAAMIDKGDHDKRFRFLLVGDGELRPKIQQLVDRMNLSSMFIMPGCIAYQDMGPYIAAADICVAYYNPNCHRELRKNGMFFDPLKVFEYLSSGRPTITLDSENMRAMFKHGEHALLLPPGRSDLLRNAICSLADDKGLCARLAENGSRLVKERYSWTAHARHLGVIFEQLRSGKVR